MPVDWPGEASRGEAIMARLMRPRVLRVCGLGLLLVWSLAGWAQGEAIVLGMSAAFTGPSRGLSIELYRGSMAYLQQVNSAGGVHGHRVAIKAYDDGYNPVPAIYNTIRLVEEDDVFLLYGYMGSPTTVR